MVPLCAFGSPETAWIVEQFTKQTLAFLDRMSHGTQCGVYTRTTPRLALCITTSTQHIDNTSQCPILRHHSRCPHGDSDHDPLSPRRLRHPYPRPNQPPFRQHCTACNNHESAHLSPSATTELPRILRHPRLTADESLFCECHATTAQLEGNE